MLRQQVEIVLVADLHETRGQGVDPRVPVLRFVAAELDALLVDEE